MIPPAVVAASVLLPSSPLLGTAAARCRANEPGPAVIVEPRGLKDRLGNLRLEVYPDNDADFLADDNVLVSQGKTFRRVIAAVPVSGDVRLCIRLPQAGSYTMSLVHDRVGSPRFRVAPDGIGFPGDPRLGWSKPKAAAARFVAGPGLTQVPIMLNYWHNLSFAPVAVAAR